MRLLPAALLLILAISVKADICATYASGNALWSTTIPNTPSANVTISSLVWLDTSPTVVYNDIEIVSGGKLYFKPGQAITLRAKQIYIRSGGTERHLVPSAS